MGNLILEIGSNPYSYPCIDLEIKEMQGKDKIKSVTDTLNNICLKKRPELQNYFSNNGNGSFIVKSAFFHRDKKVPDVYLYDLKRYRGEWRIFTYNSPRRNAKPLTKWKGIGTPSECPPQPKKTITARNILIILESPHEEEYDDNFNPLQPANKQTGENLFNYFTSYILPKLYSFELDKRKIYRICLVEPVPYQASLHFLHKAGLIDVLRNEVWKSLFTFCEDNFIQRIESYKPFVIVNACTGTKKEKEDSLRAKVRQSIDKAIVNNANGAIARAGKFRTSHPCGWKNLAMKWDENSP